MINEVLLQNILSSKAYYVVVGGISVFLIIFNLKLAIKTSKTKEGIDKINRTLLEIRDILESKSK